MLPHVGGCDWRRSSLVFGRLLPWRVPLVGNQWPGEDKFATLVLGLLALVDGDRAAIALSGAWGKAGSRAPGCLPVQMPYQPIIVSMDFTNRCYLVYSRHVRPILTHAGKEALGLRQSGGCQ